MSQTLFRIGVVLIFLVWLLVLVLRARRTAKWGISLNQFFRLAFNVFQIVSGGLLMFQLWSIYDNLQKVVGSEGIVAMFMGGVASIWLGFIEIRDLVVQK